MTRTIILSGQEFISVRTHGIIKQKIILKDESTNKSSTPRTKLHSYNSYPQSTTQNKCTKPTEFVFRDVTQKIKLHSLRNQKKKNLEDKGIYIIQNNLVRNIDTFSLQTTFNLFLYFHVTLISSSLFVQIPDHSRWITLKDIHKDSRNVILSQIQLLFLIWKKKTYSSPPHHSNRGQNYTTPKANSSLSLTQRVSYNSSGKCTARWMVATSTQMAKSETQRTKIKLGTQKIHWLPHTTHIHEK